LTDTVDLKRFNEPFQPRVVTVSLSSGSAAMTEDLVIVGGGVMGLFCAYHASERFERVVILERGRIGDPMTASFGRTRSYRCDYLDPVYARLAREAQRCGATSSRRPGHGRSCAAAA
jgi:glycine/D-amino acid oxidase-like deaminating enzyme